MLFRKTDVLLAAASMSSISGELNPGDREPLNLFPFFPRNNDRRPVWSSMKLWPVRLRRSCDDRCDELSCPTMLGGAMDTKDDAVDVAVLLLDRRLKTEVRFPAVDPVGRGGEGRSA